MWRRPVRLLVDDMLERVSRIERCLAGMEREGFLNDEKAIDSVVRNLEVIGEAANRLPQELKTRHPGIPWQRVVGLRHRIVHDYFDVDLDLIWAIVRTELPELKRQLLSLQSAIGDDPDPPGK